MRKQISAILVSAIVLSASLTAQVGAIDLNRPGDDYEHEHEHEKIQKYTCPMHPEVITDHPGNCPKCGMKLVPVKQEKRRTSNSDKSRAGVQRSTSSSDHMMHDGTEMAMSHHHDGGHEMRARSHEGHEMHMEMRSSIDLAEPMSREGSGTSWLPDSSPMYASMFMFDDNMLMLHGAIFPRYTNVSTRRRHNRHHAPKLLIAGLRHQDVQI